MTEHDEALYSLIEDMRRASNAWEAPTARDVLEHLIRLAHMLQDERDSKRWRAEEKRLFDAKCNLGGGG